MDLNRVSRRKSICDDCDYYYSIEIGGLFRIALLSLNVVKLYFKEKYNFEFCESMLGEYIYVGKKR